MVLMQGYLRVVEDNYSLPAEDPEGDDAPNDVVCTHWFELHWAQENNKVVPRPTITWFTGKQGDRQQLGTIPLTDTGIKVASPKPGCLSVSRVSAEEPLLVLSGWSNVTVENWRKAINVAVSAVTTRSTNVQGQGFVRPDADNSPLAAFSWYHGKLGRSAAEERITSAKERGESTNNACIRPSSHFLVREEISGEIYLSSSRWSFESEKVHKRLTDENGQFLESDYPGYTSVMQFVFDHLAASGGFLKDNDNTLIRLTDPVHRESSGSDDMVESFHTFNQTCMGKLAMSECHHFLDEAGATALSAQAAERLPYAGDYFLWTRGNSVILSNNDTDCIYREQVLINADGIATDAMDGLADVNEFNQKYLDGRTCHDVLPHLHLVKGIRQCRGYVRGSSDAAESCETYGLEVDLSLTTRKHLEGTLGRIMHNATKLVATSKTLQLFENDTPLAIFPFKYCRDFYLNFAGTEFSFTAGWQCGKSQGTYSFITVTPAVLRSFNKSIAVGALEGAEKLHRLCKERSDLPEYTRADEWREHQCGREENMEELQAAPWQHGHLLPGDVDRLLENDGDFLVTTQFGVRNLCFLSARWKERIIRDRLLCRYGQAEFENPLLENMSICGILDKCVKQKRPLIYNDERIFLLNPIKKVALLDAKQNGSSAGLEPCYAYHAMDVHSRTSQVSLSSVDPDASIGPSGFLVDKQLEASLHRRQSKTGSISSVTSAYQNYFTMERPAMDFHSRTSQVSMSSVDPDASIGPSGFLVDKQLEASLHRRQSKTGSISSETSAYQNYFTMERPVTSSCPHCKRMFTLSHGSSYENVQQWPQSEQNRMRRTLSGASICSEDGPQPSPRPSTSSAPDHDRLSGHHYESISKLREWLPRQEEECETTESGKEEGD
ncbi:uncharacterized protein LOC135809759 isoform X2 [Sycon ciliatum]|uniref:uncharacterized protein LOC135809759 isoform X2 n=1 Tax=Sycon ciliatum TaxID=27933 RepID=UPI0031F71326